MYSDVGAVLGHGEGALKCISMRAILGLQGVVQEGTWRVSGAMSQLANTGTNQPQPGERILLYQAGWLQQVVDGEKTMEVRSVSCQPGRAWLGSGRYSCLGTCGKGFPGRGHRGVA